MSKPIDDLNFLVTVGGVSIYISDDGSYVCFLSDLDVCNDGTGPRHGDQHYQPQTAYWNKGRFLNADQDKYIVIPPQVLKLTKGKVMGCKGCLTNLNSGVERAAVTGEIGPDYTTGEAAYCLAKIINPKVTYNSGDKSLIYLYELWPGVPAVVDGKHYHLE